MAAAFTLNFYDAEAEEKKITIKQEPKELPDNANSFEQTVNIKVEAIKQEKIDVEENLSPQEQQFTNVRVKFQHVRDKTIKWFQCGKCECQFKSESKLKKHTQGHLDGFKSVTCKICGCRTKSKKRLKLHVKNQHKIVWFPCKKCNFKSKTKIKLQRHTINKHVTAREIKCFPCEICDYIGKYKHLLIEHMINNHQDANEKKLKQSRKSEDNESESVEPQQKRKKAKTEWLTCTKCDYKCKKRIDLLAHMVEIHLIKQNKKRKVATRSANNREGCDDNK